MPSVSRVVVAALVGVLLLGAAAATAATQISTCGVHQGEGTFVITQDLDCTNEGFVLELGINNKVDFAGHTVLTDPLNGNGGSINCTGRFELNQSRTRGHCTVKDGTFHGGIRAEGRFAKVRGMNLVGGSIYGMKVFVKDSLIDAGQATPGSGNCFQSCAVQNFQSKVGRMKVVNSVVLGGRCGIGSVNSIRLKDSEVRGSTGCGLVTQQFIDESPAKISRTVIADHGEFGIRAFGAVGIKNTEITGNLGGGINAGFSTFGVGNAKIAKSIVDNNGPTGIETPFLAFVSDTPVTNHSVFGIDAEDVIVNGPSAITGNGFDPECGSTISCADIHSRNLPSLTNSATCDTSLQAGSGIPGVSWGVCAAD